MFDTPQYIDVTLSNMHHLLEHNKEIHCYRNKERDRGR